MVTGESLQVRIQNHALKQEIYWAERCNYNWIQLRDKNTTYFQIAAAIWKKANLFGKPWMNIEFGSRTKMLFGRYYLMNLARDSKKTTTRYKTFRGEKDPPQKVEKRRKYF